MPTETRNAQLNRCRGTAVKVAKRSVTHDIEAGEYIVYTGSILVDEARRTDFDVFASEEEAKTAAVAYIDFDGDVFPDGHASRAKARLPDKGLSNAQLRFVDKDWEEHVVDGVRPDRTEEEQDELIGKVMKKVKMPYMDDDGAMATREVDVTIQRSGGATADSHYKLIYSVDGADLSQTMKRAFVRRMAQGAGGGGGNGGGANIGRQHVRVAPRARL